MSDWQQADFGPDLLIPERNLPVLRDCSNVQAFDEIAFWVREQGIAICDRLINNVSYRLFELWQHIPDEKERVILKKVGFMQWPVYKYE